MSYGPEEFARDLGLHVPRETIERLEAHRRALEDWSGRMNLVGPKELDTFWRRHAFDSAQLVALAPQAKRWVDLGSGAGFPGLVVAAFVANEPGTSVHLVESTGKKAAFLRAVAEVAGLPVRVFNQRIEDFGAGDGPYDVVTARALAPLNRLIPYAKPILDRGAIGLFHKGADLDAELAAANDVLGGALGSRFRADVLESLSDPRGRIVRVTRVP
ncbi:MAG: 16S rRNA (guanine(527)-N(7))-methyltransferase RsmG [Proteobacteria bacterium]|nr:16S rRNA (guanine(527)-N(7))-methyltransferase RsmG [Pseudomonadota bacterium]